MGCERRRRQYNKSSRRRIRVFPLLSEWVEDGSKPYLPFYITTTATYQQQHLLLLYYPHPTFSSTVFSLSPQFLLTRIQFISTLKMIHMSKSPSKPSSSPPGLKLLMFSFIVLFISQMGCS